MKVYLEIQGEMPRLITEDGDIVENVDVTRCKSRTETTSEGHVQRLIVEIKILDQYEVKVKQEGQL